MTVRRTEVLRRRTASIATVAAVAATVAIVTAMRNVKASAKAKKMIALVLKKNLNGKNGLSKSAV